MLHDKLCHWTHLTAKLPKPVDHRTKTTIWSTDLKTVNHPKAKNGLCLLLQPISVQCIDPGFWNMIRPYMVSPRTQTYFRLSLVCTENNICEPEPGNDFCDVMTFVSLWPIRFHDRIKLECSSQRIPRAVVLGLGLLELNCNWLKIPTSQKSFPGSGSQTLFPTETSDSRKYVCVRRLLHDSPVMNRP